MTWFPYGGDVAGGGAQVLPQFVPKATVEFRSILGVKSRKLIELQNPNKVPIRYHITLEVRGAAGPSRHWPASGQGWTEGSDRTALTVGLGSFAVARCCSSSRCLGASSVLRVRV